MDALGRSAAPRDQENSQAEPSDLRMRPDRCHTGNHSDSKPQELGNIVCRVLWVGPTEHFPEGLGPGIERIPQREEAAPEEVGLDVIEGQSQVRKLPDTERDQR